MLLSSSESKNNKQRANETFQGFGCAHLELPDYADRGTVRQSFIPTVGAAAIAVLATAATLFLSGCGMSNLTTGLGSSLFGSSSKTTEKIAAVSEEQLLSAAKVDGVSTGGSVIAHGCPKFEIWSRDRHHTVYEPGREGDGLAIIHRGEISKTARECYIEPGRITIKYGFSGRVLLGPRGQAGTVNLPLIVYVTDPNREKVQSDSVNLSVQVAAEKPIGYFSSVRTISITVPEGSRPADYRLYVAFERSPSGAG